MDASVGGVFGASPGDWVRFSDQLGLTEDLLPVVSNPGAEVSPQSKLRDVGKTPSRYNKEHQAVGIPAWTAYRATERDIARWQREGDYGICVQTRSVRAIDIDITDAVSAQRVCDVIELLVGKLPMRFRNNSSKCLLVFHLAGKWTKRILRTDHGAIEFLADGQQFIAAGTHPSGARYEWEGGLPHEIPYLSAEEYEAVWSVLREQFAIASFTRQAATQPQRARRGEDAVRDDMLTYLEDQGWVRSFDSQGRAHIRCPWEHEHSDAGQGSESATSYFPRGVGGFEQGHFRCLHAHCEGRTDGDFAEAVGYVLADFDEVPAPPPGFVTVDASTGDVQSEDLLPAFERGRSGEILATVGNLQLALARPRLAGVRIGWDGFTDELMLASEHADDWRRFGDADYVRLRIRLEGEGFKPIGRELIRDVVGLIAEEQRFDSAQLWLSGLTWDGVPRVERFWAKYFRAEDSPYTRGCGTYIWSAMAGRVLDPGCKVDMVPILVGAQGVGKSTGVAAMVPHDDHFMEVRLDEDETALARRMRGKLIGEIGELRGLQSREIEHVKAFVTRTHEEWVPKFREFATKFPRRLVLVGTTNADEFLADDTGNRRWLPIRVGTVDVDQVKHDLEQLWAEGAVLFTQGGVHFKGAELLARDVHADHMITDPWEDPVRAWLDDPVFGEDPNRCLKNGQTFFKMNSLLQSALGLDVRQLARKDELRVGRVLRKLGYEKVRLRDVGPHVAGLGPHLDGPGPLRVWVWANAENRAKGQLAFNCQFAGGDDTLEGLA